MMMPLRFEKDFFQQALAGNGAALTVAADARIRAMAGVRACVPCSTLSLQYYAQLDGCRIVPEPEPLPNYHLHWGGEDNDQLYREYSQVIWRVDWQGQLLHVVQLEWSTECGHQSRHWVLADTPQIAETFILDVNRRTNAPGNAILVFSDAGWERNEELYAATQQASFDSLVLPAQLKEQIRTDFRQFIAAEPQYERLGIAWRRGAIFIGPPGNGKTHCVRALVKELAIPSLYVQSLNHPYYTTEQLWARVFDRARSLRPCVLVLEDLDSLVNDENRSFFLNQLDGFEQNHGLIVLATTNYPERIDAAIIDRPSRFDRKYHFGLPSLSERLVYLQAWQARLVHETGWRPEEVAPLAEATPGFSFAYLKELMISSVLHWLHHTQHPFLESAQQQVRLLQGQRQTELAADRGTPPKPPRE